MNKIRFTRVWGERFGSYESFDFVFKPGKHMVSGTNRSTDFAESNGSGKSWLFEAPSWCLFDRTLREKNISMNKKGKCFVGLEFYKEEDRYEVIRTFGKKEGKKKNDVILRCNGEKVSPRNTENIEDTIERTLGIPYDLFVIVVTVLQGLPINLSSMTPTIRKTVLETMMGIDNWDIINKLFQTEKKRVNDEYNSLVDKYNESEDLMIAKNSEVQTLKGAATKNYGNLKEELHEVKKRISKTRQDVNYLESKREMCSEKDPNDIEEDLDTLKASISVVQREIENLVDLIEDGTCPTCGQHYPESMIEDAKVKLEAFDNKLPKMNARASSMQTLLDGITEMDNDIRVAKRELRVIEAQMNSIIDRMDEDKEDSTGSIEDLQTVLDELVAEVNVLNEDLKQKELRLEGITYILSLLLPSSSFRTKVLEKYLGYINSILAEVSVSILDDMIISLVVDKKANGVEIQITSTDKDRNYKSLSGGEKRRVDVIIILSLQRFLLECTGVSTNLLVFDEIFDSLDNVGIQMILNCIDQIFDESLCVYIITHKNDFRQSFESIIEIEKVNDVSSIV
jgi:DNA repair exonuclease SbcCD ATPase subunit